MIAEFFARPAVKFGAIALAVVAIAGGTAWVLRGEFNKGEKAGAASVTNAVQTDTIKRTHDAVQKKERADDEVRRTPYKDLVDQLD